MVMQPANSTSKRTGFVLPSVLIAMLLIAFIAATLQAAMWRATRSARLGLSGERALQAADAAIAQNVAAWDARAFSKLNIGERVSSVTSLAPQLSATVTIS